MSTSDTFDSNTNHNIYYLFLLIIPILFLILIIFSELIRLYRVKCLVARICRNPSQSDIIGTPYYSLSLLGSFASVHKVIFSSKNSHVHRIRAFYSDKYKGIYLSYSWNFWNLSNNLDMKPALILTDPKLVSAVMNNPEVWVKPLNDGIIGLIIGKSCTAARGKDAIRQRKIISKSFSNRSQYEGYLSRASKKFIENLLEEVSISVSSSDGLGVSLNIVPKIKLLAADIITWMVFGCDTEGVEEFKVEYVKYWDFLRIVIFILLLLMIPAYYFMIHQLSHIFLLLSEEF